MMRGHEDTVMLGSTTSSYERPVIEVAYGEMIFLLHRGCMGDDSSRRVVGVSRCRHNASPMFDIPGSTLVWAQCILFFGFLNTKTYVYVYRFQNLYV